MRRPLVHVMPLAFAAALAVDGAAAQCGFSYAPANAGDPISAPRGSVHASTYWDPDGAGPLPTCLVVGGMFGVANNPRCSVAYFDGSTWTPIGVPSETTVIEDVPCVALTVHNGDLVAATGTKVYLHTGGSWQWLGLTQLNPLAREIDALASFQGSIYVGGSFATMTANAGTAQTGRGIARWNGTNWSSVGGANVSTFAVKALAAVGNRLYAGGSFASIGGVAASNLAAWDGAVWSSFGNPNSGVTGLGVRTGLSTTTTFLFVAGGFTQIGGIAASKFARNPVTLVGAPWQPMDGLPSTPSRLSVRGVGLSSYECLATVNQTIYRWNGSSWDTEFALSSPTVGTVGSYGDVVFGSVRRDVQLGWLMSHAIECADGATLHGQGIAGDVLAVADWNGQRVIAGDFQRVGGVVVNGIAIGDSGAWQPLGAGLTGGNGKVRALFATGGLLYAGGEFSVATGGVADGVAVWNGTSWQPLGAGLNGPVHALVRGANGIVYAGGAFTASGATAVCGLARFNGAAWQVDSGGLDGNASTAVVDHLALVGNDLYIGGRFTTAGSLNTVVNNLVRHDTASPLPGASWYPLTRVGASAPGVGVVRALAATDDGVLVAHRDVPNAGWTDIAEIAGASIAPYAATPNTTMRAHEVDGIVGAPSRTFLVVRGTFEHRQGTTVLYTAQLSSAISISPASIGVASGGGAPAGEVPVFAVAGDGSLLIGNGISYGFGPIRSGFVRSAPQCPTAAASVGTGCGSPASGVVPDLLVETQPWIGSVCRLQSNGITGSVLNLAIAAIGVQQIAVPLAAILPVGGACDLLVDPIVTLGLTPTNGIVRHDFAIPFNTALVGQQLLDQVVRVDFGVNGIAGLGASPALRLTIGSLY